MKCNSCGRENPEGSRFCNTCGQQLMVAQPGPPSNVQPVQQPHQHRRCVACGRSIDMDVNVCPYCGYDYRYRPR